jgi:hypothetical protein
MLEDKKGTTTVVKGTTTVVNNSAPARGVAVMKTFASFLDTDESRQGCDPKLHARLVSASAGINSLNALVRWARERHPDHYAPDPRKPTGMPYGREAMQRLWANYLAWSEEVES